MPSIISAARGLVSGGSASARSLLTSRIAGGSAGQPAIKSAMSAVKSIVTGSSAPPSAPAPMSAGLRNATNVIVRPTGSRMDPLGTGAGYGPDGKYYPDAASLAAARAAYMKKKSADFIRPMPVFEPNKSSPIIMTPPMLAPPKPAPAPAAPLPSPEVAVVVQTASGGSEPTVVAPPAPVVSSAGSSAAPAPSAAASLAKLAAGAGAGFLVGGPIGAAAGAAAMLLMKKKEDTVPVSFYAGFNDFPAVAAYGAYDGLFDSIKSFAARIVPSNTIVGRALSGNYSGAVAGAVKLVTGGGAATAQPVPVGATQPIVPSSGMPSWVMPVAIGGVGLVVVMLLMKRGGGRRR